MTETWGRLWWKFTEIPIYQEWDFCTLFPGRKGEQNIVLDRKLNGYGGAQTFFLCPTCGARVRYLYFNGQSHLFRCRKCSHLNYKSQQRTKDADDGYNAAMAIAKEKLQVYERPPGFCFVEYVPPRPRYMHRTTYQRYLRRFLKHRERYTERMYNDLFKLAGVLGDVTKCL